MVYKRPEHCIVFLKIKQRGKKDSGLPRLERKCVRVRVGCCVRELLAEVVSHPGAHWAREGAANRETCKCLRSG